MPKFRIGNDDFLQFRQEDGYFADKSLLIKEVIEGQKVTLLPRPHRFGKTLNMTMLRYFFQKSDKDHSHLFTDLAINQHSKYMAHQGQYPVIYLSLKDINGTSWDEVFSQLTRSIAKEFDQHTVLLDLLNQREKKLFLSIQSGEGKIEDYKGSLKELISWLYKYYNKPVIVLIDEYDTPVIKAWQKGYYDQMIEFMRSWLGGGLKHEEGNALYRAVVTGILQVAKESLFSGLNNLDVSTILKIGPYADKFGFTQEELDQILHDFNLPQLAVPMREWYNGYNFGGKVIYNPWSVIKTVNDWPNDLAPHWLNTASNELVNAELEAGGFALKRDLEKLLSGEELRYPISEHTVFDDIGKDPSNIWSFLCFSGYLRAEDPKENPVNPNQRDYKLTIPNREISIAYEQFIRQWYNTLKFVGTQDLLTSLIEEKYHDFEYHLNILLLNLMSYYDPAQHPEAAYHCFVLGLLANLRCVYEIRSNPETGYGRADILMRSKKESVFPVSFVIEFKVIKPDEEREKAVQEAFRQIEDKAYTAQLVEAGVAEQKIRKLAIVVQERQVVVRQNEKKAGKNYA